MTIEKNAKVHTMRDEILSVGGIPLSVLLNKLRGAIPPFTVG